MCAVLCGWHARIIKILGTHIERTLLSLHFDINSSFLRKTQDSGVFTFSLLQVKKLPRSDKLRELVYSGIPHSMRMHVRLFSFFCQFYLLGLFDVVILFQFNFTLASNKLI